LISVEKRSRPNWMSKAGVTVPWIIACTAMGIAGVGDTAMVGGMTGEGVITIAVGVTEGGIGVSVGGPGEAVSDT